MTPSMSASTAMPKPAGMRQMNERIVLQAVRVHGPCRKSEIARLTHLSTQTTSLIVDNMIDDGLRARYVMDYAYPGPRSVCGWFSKESDQMMVARGNDAA